MKTIIQINLDEARTLIGEALNAKTPGKRHQVSAIFSSKSVGFGMNERDEPDVRFEADVTDIPKIDIPGRGRIY